MARKIITFNLLALVILVAGVLYQNPFRDSLVFQRERGLVAEAKLIADVFEAQIEARGARDPLARDKINATLKKLDLLFSLFQFQSN